MHFLKIYVTICCTSLCSIRRKTRDRAADGCRVIFLTNSAFRHKDGDSAEKWQSCSCLDRISGLSGEMERFNRPGMDLITPGGVGQPEPLQTDDGTTTFFVS